ncbi:MAG: DUF6241 domain-containing protein [Peptostreptococcaceae bacterium]
MNLYNVIDKLEEEYKDVIILKHMYNLELEEIASVLDISKEIVKNNLKNSIDEINKISNEEISSEYIDLISNEFYIDKDKINSIVCVNLENSIKESLDKGVKESKKSNKRKILTGSIIFILLIGFYGIISKPTYQVDSMQDEAPIEIGTDEKNIKIPDNELESIMLIHKMSNSIIIPVDNKKYGSIEITPKTIQIASDSLEYVKDEKAKSYLSEALNSWNDGEFLNGVQVHNYVWRALDGEVGKAKSINEEEVDKVLKTHFK